ncbi:DEAD/DEAH box helicase [Sphingomonas aliaeris]|uniref:Transcription-repair-coupling factor n=1 Tax=Sphingomonas aliaeris TaxID=2759526 RepID=A0A974NY46_9SPHN|nr:DEAD/DEAH box helicase [Sphingomonas aliaeris]
MGVVTVRIAEALDGGDVLAIVSDEQRAERIAIALRRAAPQAQVVHCPSSDALPGDTAPASPSNIGRRVAALRAARIAAGSSERPPFAFVTTAEAAASAFPAPVEFDRAPPVMRTGDTLDVADLSATLEEIGYVVDDRVDEPGEVAIRGNVVDLYPADATMPVRIEFGAGKIVAIRAYDPVSQLSCGELDEVELGRAAEPAIGENWTTLFDHLPKAVIAIDPDAAHRRDRFLALSRNARRGAGTVPVVDADSWKTALADRTVIDLASDGETPTPRFVEKASPRRAAAQFAKKALAAVDRLVLLGAERDLRFLAPKLAKAVGIDPVHAESWRDILDRPAGSLMLLAMPVDRGWQSPGLAVIAANDLLGSRALDDHQPDTAIDPLAGLLGDIRIDDVVVHEDFGVAVVAGIEPMTVGSAASDDMGDAIVLEHAGGGRRLISVDDADRIWRYGADADAVALDKLDGSSWEKRRSEVHAVIAESARALIEVAAERDSRTADVLEPNVEQYEQFAAGFGYVETPDQARAIAAVRADLASGKPMERLVVGDVGYGKTEVALRAAAIAALAGKQVVIAAPTTVLVRQHLEQFSRRFEKTGLNVAALSRLSTPAERKAVKAGLADGSIAVVVGTGAVAGKGVVYHDLGLVVIDEEQRFGAADKARLRDVNPDGHVLTLTATPIPRTLQTAMIGLQQLSVIATPPARRQPIRTSVGSFDDAVVRTALLREKGRGGQSFVVVSRIEDMEPMAKRLAKLVPPLTIRSAHGKMPALEIDEAMVAFAGGDGDVLLATNIIEAGLDVPRANTMIVWRADRFGLSQLHQLRGRVGRGGRRGQIMLLTDPDTAIADATLKRLRTLEALDRLGAGFAISARDLDMRGAGDLLGDAQAGHMKLIGVDLYQHLLKSALQEARGETVDRWTPLLRVGVAGRLPEDWIPEADVRVSLYGRLSRLTTLQELDRFEAELEDRFGALPDEVGDLLALARLRINARLARIARIDAGPSAIALTPRPEFEDSGLPDGFERKDGRILARVAITEPRERLDHVSELLADLAHED